VTPSSEPTVPLSVNDVKVGPLAKAGEDLTRIYREYLQQGAGATFIPSALDTVKIVGTSVEVDAHMSGGSISDYASALGGLGMQILYQDPISGTIEGYLPISKLQAAAQLPQTLSLSPVSRGLTHA